MKNKVLLTAVVATTLTCGIATSASAEMITTLYNTGVDASGNPLPDGTLGDPHYTITNISVTSPSYPLGTGTTDTMVRTSVGGYPIGPWIGDDLRSAWIGPANDSQLNGPPAIYTYETTFTVSAFAAPTAMISGGWSTDNNGIEILLNGNVVVNQPTSFTQFSAGFNLFSITSGFQAGLNTLDFIVSNGHYDDNPNTGTGGSDPAWNPTGLRVEMTGTVDAPVPPTVAMSAILFGMIGVVASFRVLRKSTVVT
jgi:hypothetical protein